MVTLDSLRDESHTGSNRCWPCTVVNLAIVGAGVILLLARQRRFLGTLVAVLGLVAIYLRGYLVPYTPQFAPQVVAVSPLPEEWFHDGPEPETGDSLARAVEIDGETVFTALSDADVIEASDDMLFLTEAVEAAWTEQMDELAGRSLDSLADALSSSLSHIDDAEPYVDDDREWLVVGSDPGKLIARPVAVAELAAYQVLSDVLSDEPIRLASAETFRMFLDSCPVCDSELVDSSTVSCCGGHTGPRQNPSETLVCPTCEQRLYTFDTQ